MRGQLMRLFTVEQHRQVLDDHKCNVKAADVYNTILGQLPYAVTRQNVKYWRKIFGGDKTNMAKADRALKEDRQLQAPTPLQGDIKFDPRREYESILVIPDQHAPYQHKDALPFLTEVARAFSPDLVVNLGDELDYHAMSFHDSDPNLDSAGVELEKGKVWLAKLAKLFPVQLVCDSNHGSMHYRKAKAHGLPVQLLRTYREIIFPGGGGDGWEWAESWTVQTPAGPVMFKHQSSGTILVDAAHNRCNLMVGHNHGNFSVEYSSSPAALYWGCYSGCLIDKNAEAFAYGRHTLRRPIIGATVILNGLPMLIPMRLDADGRWVGRL
jgi:hypothetical protein